TRGRARAGVLAPTWLGSALVVVASTAEFVHGPLLARVALWSIATLHLPTLRFVIHSAHSSRKVVSKQVLAAQKFNCTSAVRSLRPTTHGVEIRASFGISTVNQLSLRRRGLDRNFQERQVDYQM